MECPKCGSDCWDNRPKKATGEFKANAPDFKCKNDECKHGIWPDSPEGSGPGKPVPEMRDVQPNEFDVSRVLERAIDAANYGVKHAEKLGWHVPDEARCAWATSAFIQLHRGG